MLLEEDPEAVGWLDGDTEADGVLIGTETLVSGDESQVFLSEMSFTSTVVPKAIA